MIMIGTTSISDDGLKVTIDAPGGFGAYSAVRLTNYTANALVLTNISGNTQGQSQELILPLTQMVYHTKNVQAVPVVSVYGVVGALQVAPNVIAEWSTDPLEDFQGTYPTTLGTPSAAPYLYVSTQDTFGTIAGVLDANPFRRSVTIINKSYADPATSPDLGIFWWAGMGTTPVFNDGQIIEATSGRSVDVTSAIYFLPRLDADANYQLEIIEETWGSASTWLLLDSA